MSTRPEKIFVLTIDGKPKLAYLRKEDIETYLYINDIPAEGAEITEITFIAYPTYGLGGTKDELRDRQRERLSSSPPGS